MAEGASAPPVLPAPWWERRPSPGQDAPGTPKEGTAKPSAGLLLARGSLPNLPPSALPSHRVQWAAAANGPPAAGAVSSGCLSRWHTSLQEAVLLPGLQHWLQIWKLGSGPYPDWCQAVNRVVECEEANPTCWPAEEWGELADKLKLIYLHLTWVFPLICWIGMLHLHLPHMSQPHAHTSLAASPWLRQPTSLVVSRPSMGQIAFDFRCTAPGAHLGCLSLGVRIALNSRFSSKPGQLPSICVSGLE